VLGPGHGYRPDELQLAGAKGALGGLLERVRGPGVAAAGLEQASVTCASSASATLPPDRTRSASTA
jgi:hypothetical protein